MSVWLLGLGLAGILHGVQLDLDCASPAAATDLIGRARLSEIEWAEDVNRAAMWEAFGRCPAGPGAEACRAEHRARFGARMDGQKAAIEAKYRLMLRDFEDRCRASIVRLPATGHRSSDRGNDAPIKTLPANGEAVVYRPERPVSPVCSGRNRSDPFQCSSRPVLALSLLH